MTGPEYIQFTISVVTYQVTYQVRPHLIHGLEPDEAIGPSGRLVHEEAYGCDVMHNWTITYVRLLVPCPYLLTSVCDMCL